MIRIGFVRFDISVAAVPLRDGRDEFSLRLTPQARAYRVLLEEWSGLHDQTVEKEIPTEAFSVTFAEPRGDYSAVARSASRAADELAGQAVYRCSITGLIDHRECNHPAASFLVKSAVLNAVRRNQSDPLVPQVELIDLVPDMRAMAEERKRREEEEERRRAEQLAAHEAEMAKRAAVRNEAARASFDLLYSTLSDPEVEEAKEKGQVTLRLAWGIFVVPLRGHGLVRRYGQDGKYESSYCIVFEDYSIPAGDEAVMKIALLKADPKRFFGVAHKFDEGRRGPKIPDLRP